MPTETSDPVKDAWKDIASNPSTNAPPLEPSEQIQPKSSKTPTLADVSKDIPTISTSAIESAEAILKEAQEAHAKAQETIAKAEYNLEEAKTNYQKALPPKVYFNYDRDTFLEADCFVENKDGTLNIICSNVLHQKFMTGVSSPPGIREFLNVRKGSGRGDVGSYFIE